MKQSCRIWQTTNVNFCMCLLLVGKHIEFCCHLKRGNVKHGSNPTYEYVKFILSIRDVSSGKQFSF